MEDVVGFSDKASNAVFFIFGTFSAIEFFICILTFMLKGAQFIALARFVALPTLIIYGTIAAWHANKSHFQYFLPVEGFHRDHHVVVSEMIHAIVGLVLLGWMLVSGTMIYGKSKSSPAIDTEWGKGTRLSGLFYIHLIDLGFFVATVIALVHGSHFTPWTNKPCKKKKYGMAVLFKVDQMLQQQCNVNYTVEVMGLITCIFIALQTIMLVPLIRVPKLLRTPFTSAIRFLRKRSAPKSVDLEKGSLDLEVSAKLSDSEVEVDIREQPCCLQSDGAEKSSCWACERLICKNCAQEKTKVPYPRTKKHMENCYAVCTKCYVWRAQTNAAPTAAIWNPHDLTAQHFDCDYTFCGQYAQDKGIPSVSLCNKCAESKTLEQLVQEREVRDTGALQLMVRRKIKCKLCERSLPKHKRRWWICELGPHECHWSGHDLRL